jgi:Tol biopolymer transport system component
MLGKGLRIVAFLACVLALVTGPAASAPIPVPEPEAAMMRIAFVSTRDGTSEIYAMNADGSEQSRLTVNTAQDVSPAWSPNGQRIAFASNRDGDWEIYTIDADGNGLQRLTDSPGFDGAPSWSPDGTQIAFASARDGNSEIYVMDADGADQTRLTTSPGDDAVPAWAPDSPACGARARTIAFESDRSGNYDIYSVDPEGSGLEQLTTDPAPDFDPSWAPDCSALAFDRVVAAGEYDIFRLDLQTKTATRLTFVEGEDSRPAWSPDGDTIAFTSLRDGHYEIYVMGARDGGGQVDLSQSFPSTDAQPAWEPPAIGGPVGRPFGTRRIRRAAAGPKAIQLTCGIGPSRGGRINGTPSADIICSDDAAQTLAGARGDDTIIDLGGRDTVYGGRGRDVINTRDGAKDIVTGGPGVDEINADRFDVVRKPTGDAIAP